MKTPMMDSGQIGFPYSYLSVPEAVHSLQHFSLPFVPTDKIEIISLTVIFAGRVYHSRDIFDG